MSNRLIYCFDDAKKLAACDSGSDRKNAAWNDVWVFDEKGLVPNERLTALRPTITSNAKCGTCHGYNAEHGETEINMTPAGFPSIHAREECGDPRALEMSSVKLSS